MKRSEVNAILKEGKEFMTSCHFFLPPWAKWFADDWRRSKVDYSEVTDNLLGWDVTDFGSGDFYKRGLLLFTLRNGKLGVDHKPYAEKIMVVEENQETPLHFHWHKMEDIINRGGGNLVLELYNATSEESLADTEVVFKTDGVEKRIAAGGTVVLRPGESICLQPYVYHRFYGEPGKGKVLVGEVSAVNDDANDNRFHAPVGRFPEIEEDVPPMHLLVSDYQKFL
jgi:D-lyxose ketol-isomerase